MQIKFVHLQIVEGFHSKDGVINVDHIIQFEPNRATSGHTTLYMTDGKVITVAESFDKLIHKFNGLKYAI